MSKILVIAPHPDDELIGVGGTIAKKIRMGDDVTVLIVTKGYEPLHNTNLIEKGIQEDYEANKILGVSKTIRLNMPANELDILPQYRINNEISEIIKKEKPDEVFIPFHGDIHIDHKLIADSAMVAMRPKFGCNIKRILSYEVPSETGWNFSSFENVFAPNVFEDITATINKKRTALKKMKSQIPKTDNARSIENITALAKVRGSMVGFKFAEAFMLERELV